MPLLDFSSQEEIKIYQEQRLHELLNYLNSNSPFYQKHFRKHNIDIEQIRSIKDLAAIPVITKDELQKNNVDFFCVPPKSIVEYCTTSGTMGTPVVVALTDNDLNRLAQNELQSFLSAGMTENDIVLLMLSLDRQFMAGIAYYLGARALGAGIIRGGPGNFAMQLETINRLQPTVLIAVPSFIASLMVFADEHTIDLNKTSVKKIICIGENIRNDDLSPNTLADRITSSWHVSLFSTYASTEQQTAFTECSEGKGGHHHPDLLLFEIVDTSGNPLPPLTYGELVITTLGVEGMPLLRYNTGDICMWISEKCSCGRTTSRISPIAGRKQQMIKFKGTTFYPQSIFNILNSLEGIQDYVINLSNDEFGNDDLDIIVAIRPGLSLTDTIIRQRIQSALRVVPGVRYLPVTEIQKMQVAEGKRKIHKLIDNRL